MFTVGVDIIRGSGGVWLVGEKGCVYSFVASRELGFERRFSKIFNITVRNNKLL